MTLKDYLKKHQISASAFAALIGGTTAMSVSRWVNGKAIPNRDSMAKIKAATGGEVTPDDFYWGA